VNKGREEGDFRRENKGVEGRRWLILGERLFQEHFRDGSKNTSKWVW
jgi:hypothetical protein